jgi:enoyl-CoA hydratase
VPADAVLVECDGPVRILTLNRPDALNAFDEELHRELPRALADLDRDREARAIVLTGAGRAFSAGGDLATFEILANDLELRRQTLRAGRRLFDELMNTHLPLVAAVNGPAVGLGATVVTACDMVFMAENAFLADPHVTVALVAGDGGAATWPLHMSLLRAKEFLLTGDRLDARRALELGMANRVVPAETLMAEALAFAHRLASLPPQAVQDTKALLNQWIRQAAVSTLGYGLAAESQSHDTAEFRAGPQKVRRSAPANG